jgi:hypothetical protein
MEKITKAMNDKTARENAIKALGLDTLDKVSNTEYAISVKDAEGNDKVVVIKLTVPKAQLSIGEMVANYQEERAEIEARAEEKALLAKQKKAEKLAKKNADAVKEVAEF